MSSIVYNPNTSSANKQLFTSSGSFTVPTGVTTIYVSGCGGGGSGSATVATSACGGGGAACVLFQSYTVIPGTTYTVTIGAGGAGANTQFGNSGGTTSLGALVSLPGGGGGNSQTGTPGASGGFGGTRGSYAISTAIFGAGGSTLFGIGGPSSTTGNPTSITGSGYGSGSGGTSSNSAAGANGFLLIEW